MSARADVSVSVCLGLALALLLPACGDGSQPPLVVLDRDGDGVDDTDDAFPDDPSEQVDLDGDGTGDNADTDDDGDDVADVSDAFPRDPTEWVDADGDGAGDNGDLFAQNPDEWADTDGDGVGDNSDAFPSDATETNDANEDGVGDNSQRLVESGVEPAGDNCPHGGAVTWFGLDENDDAALQPSEIDASQNFYTCDPERYAIGGTVTGVPVDGTDAVGLLNLGGDAVVRAENGTFSFPSELVPEADYGVTVGVQPLTRYCETSATSTGTVGTGPVSNVAITCYANGQVTTRHNFQSGGVAVDASDNLYVADFLGHAVRKISPSGVVTTLAGGMDGFTDGQGSEARFRFPYDVALDADGNVYVSDVGAFTIRKITPDGMVTTLAGTGGVAGFTDGQGAAARFITPRGLTVDSAGNVYVVDNDTRLRKVSPTGAVTTWQSSGGFASNPGSPAQSIFTDVAASRSGTVYVADANLCDCVLQTNAAGVIGILPITYSTTGSRYQNITGLAVDANDNLYVADTQYGNYRIRRHGPASVGVSNINDLATISQPEQTVLQSGSPGNADGIQATARFSAAPAGIAVDRAGHVFVADRDNQRIRKVYFVPGDIPPVPPPVVVSVSANDASQLGEELLPAFNADPAAVLLLGALRASWDTGLYGPRPADGVLIDFAWERCKADPDECNTLADAMDSLLLLTRTDGTYFAILAAWEAVRGSPGWGGDSLVGDLVCSGSLAEGSVYCASSTRVPMNSPRVPDEIERAMWTSVTSPVNIVNTVTMLQALLTALEEGDPGYGTTLSSALQNLGEDSAITRGLATVVLFMEAMRIADRQRSGETITPEQQVFAQRLVAQTQQQERAALDQLRAEFTAHQEANRPPATRGGLYYLGTAPTEAHERALLTLLPQSSGNTEVDDTATMAFRLLTAIGQSQRDVTVGEGVDVHAVAAGVGLGVPLASAVVALGAGLALASASAALTATSLTVTVLATGITVAGTTAGIKGGVLVVAAASLAGSIGGTAGAAALVGPAALIVAAIAVLGAGGAIVAEINDFTRVMEAMDAILRLQAMVPPTLGDLTDNESPNPFNPLVLGTDTQVLYSVTQLVGG
ncbi:MAG: hypothetical protein IPH72_15830 [Sandaracinaceae bacterium]|nr:hypothetical protein [Sandaracinaceae bacterium]